MKNVWIVSEGSPGHVSQSVGFAKVLAQLIPLQTQEVFGRTTVRGWQRHLIRYWMGKRGSPVPAKWLPKIADIKIPDGAGVPDLIVSSGGKSVFVAHFFAAKYSVPYIFIGERKPYPSSWFHTVYSPVEREVNENTFLLDLIPTPVTPELIAAKGTQEKNTWCMIIGGASRSYPFSDTDWVELARGMNQLAERENIRWLLTTSRRTGAAAEAILKRELNPAVLKDAIWWAENPRRELYAFMARSEVLFVTQDSITMVTEAVASGRPAVTVDLFGTKFTPDNFLPAYFKRMAQNKYIQTVYIHDMAAFSLVKSGGAPAPDSQLKNMIRRSLPDFQTSGARAPEKVYANVLSILR
jgi:hypothetical protein